MTTALATNKAAQDAVSNTTKTLNALKAIADLTPDAKAKLDEATKARKNAESRFSNAQKKQLTILTLMLLLRLKLLPMRK